MPKLTQPWLPALVLTSLARAFSRPGDRMFAISSDGVPSVAKFVHIEEAP